MATPPAGGRPRFAKRVTPEHLRQRVSLRYLVDDPEQGAVPTDVVGRLIAFQDDTLVVVDRAASLHIIDESRVLASRPVPPHPKLPPEPDVGTEDRPLERAAARVILLDPDDRILLASFSPNVGEAIWTAPGGGLDPGEDHEQAARRELREELAIDVELGPWVWSRRATFSFRGVWIDQAERWYLARTASAEVAATSPDAGMDRVRWWTREELHRTDDRLAPRELPHHLDDLLDHGPPAEPVEVGR
jgi:8-oxo-dGTP pyrophosphatase MutT (NUDIX family)